MKEISDKKAFEGRDNFTVDELAVLSKVKSQLEEKRKNLFHGGRSFHLGPFLDPQTLYHTNSKYVKHKFIIFNKKLEEFENGKENVHISKGKSKVE